MKLIIIPVDTTISIDGESIEGCDVSWMPFMAVEIAQKSNQTGAAVESFRNEVVKGNQQNQQLYIQALQQGIIPMQVTPLNSLLNILKEGKGE